MTYSQGTSENRIIFYTIIFAQFCGTSLWFAGNTVLPQLQQLYLWPTSALGYLTGAVQFGFILGTLIFSLLGIADRFSPSKIFFTSCVAGAVCNAVTLTDLSSYQLILSSRLLTGFCLAGIYPVGMKIAADWREHGLGHWLGALVGALVLGTAFPYGLKLIPQFVEAQKLLMGISALAFLGGLALFVLVPNGPFRKAGTRFNFAGIRNAFKVPAFRAPALGYFGHMWELYAFWTFLPWAIDRYKKYSEFSFNPALFSFIVIASGAAGCVAGGQISFKKGSEKVASVALIISGICCLISPFIWHLPAFIFMTVMIIWGIAVAADSPQFSALVARNAPADIRGSAITMVTCIGFTITIVSIQLLSIWKDVYQSDFLFLLLAPGPVLGVLFFRKMPARQYP
jgi:MFS family permease